MSSAYQKELQNIQEENEKKIKENKDKLEHIKDKQQKFQNQLQKSTSNAQFDNPMYYQLPQKKKVDFRNEQYKKKFANISQEHLEITEKMQNHILEKAWCWDYANNQKFKFVLPESLFDELQKNDLTYLPTKEVVQPQNQKLGRLSSQQLKQIKSNGTFDVVVPGIEQPYVWQISSWIIRSDKKIVSQYIGNMGKSFILLYEIDLILLPKRIWDIRKYLKSLLMLVFGLPSMNYPTSQQIEDILEKQRQKELLQNHKQHLDYSLSQFLCALNLNNSSDNEEQQILKAYNAMIKRRFEQLHDIHKKFIDEWSKLKVQLENENQDKSDEEFFKILRNKQRELLFSEITQCFQQNKLQAEFKNEEEAQKVMTNILNLLFAFQSAKQLIEDQNKFISENRDKISQSLKTNHSIKSKCSSWLEKNISQQLKPLEESKKKETLQKQLQYLSEQALQPQLYAQKQYAEYLEKEKQLVKEQTTVTQQRLKTPTREFITARHLFKPYVEKKGNRYYAVRDVLYTTKTDVYFWRLRLMFIRYFVWTSNIVFFLKETAINSIFGLKMLFSTKKYFTDFYVKSETGEIIKTNEITPWLLILYDIYEGGQKSRARFEAKPDTGLFGKNFSRLFNLIEVYIFRYLIGMIIIIGILYPIAVFVYVIASIILSLTSWAWIPFAQVIRYVFNILIFDTDRPQRDDYHYQIYFTLFRLILSLVWNLGIKLIFDLVKTFVLRPIGSLLIALFAHILYVFQKIQDCIMLQAVRILGKVPITDTSIAWKISGVGIGRQFFYQISDVDFQIQLYSKLEKYELSVIKKKLHELIEEPKNNWNNIQQALFGVFEQQIKENYQISQSVYDLLDRLSKQLYSREKILPKCPSQKIRFLQEELDVYVPKAIEIIKNFIQKRGLDRVVFKEYNIQQDDYNKLAEIFLKETFGSEILDPLESLEKRFTLKQVKDPFQVQAISNILEGKVELIQKTQYLKPKFRKPQKYYVDIADLKFVINIFMYKEVETFTHQTLFRALKLHYFFEFQNDSGSEIQNKTLQYMKSYNNKQLIKKKQKNEQDQEEEEELLDIKENLQEKKNQ